MGFFTRKLITEDKLYVGYPDYQPNVELPAVDLQLSGRELRIGHYYLYHPGSIDHLSIDVPPDEKRLGDAGTAEIQKMAGHAEKI
jgi:hypothetical protein